MDTGIPDLRDLTLEDIASLPITDEVLKRIIRLLGTPPVSVAAFQSAI